MSAIWLTLREFVTSKKFIAAVAGVIIATAGKYNLNLEPDSVQNIVYVIVAYLIGQGWADSGKEAAKVNGTVAIATSDALSAASAANQIAQPVKDKLI